MKKYKWIIILVNLLLVLGLFNQSVIEKETMLSEGQLVLLKLAPIDPRSLMQGDFMRLRYAIARRAEEDSVIAKRGYCVVRLDENGVAQRVRLQNGPVPLGPDELLLPYTSQVWGDINIGAESFFFQEGEGEKFEKAEYGGLRVDSQGNSVLVGLYDKAFMKIE